MFIAQDLPEVVVSSQGTSARSTRALAGLFERSQGALRALSSLVLAIVVNLG